MKHLREARATRYLAQKRFEREQRADDFWEGLILSGAVLFTVMVILNSWGAV